MKLEKYIDKDKKRRKTIIISLGVIVLISVSFLLYKTFASFTESAEFPIMKGKVDYFGNSDIYFAFYKGDEQLDTMPVKDNPEGLVFDYGECDNGASIIWDNENWAPLVKNLKKSKTKCTLYFGKPIELDKDIQIVESGDGLYKVSHNNLEELGTEWSQTEYRYAGVNPNNYVRFNNEIWRIIGLVNVEVESGEVEQRIKIIRMNDTKGQTDFEYGYSWDYKLLGNGSTVGNLGCNNWTDSQLKDMLNGIYYNSMVGNCYLGSSSPSTCNFTNENGVPRGLNEEARKMIDKDVVWNLGGWEHSKITAKSFYEKERGNSTGNLNQYPNKWTKNNDQNYHNGVALLYPSDYGYAVGGEVRKTCLETSLKEYNTNNCVNNDWLNAKRYNKYTITIYSISNDGAFAIDTKGQIDTSYSNVDDPATIEPTLYLQNNIKIAENLTDDYGSINNPFSLITLP